MSVFKHTPLMRALALVILIAGCNLTQADHSVAATRPPYITEGGVVSPVPTLGRLSHPQVTGIAAQPDTPTPDICIDSGMTLAARHRVVADVDYRRHQARVQQRILYTNQTDTELSQIVLNVGPRFWPDAFFLVEVTSGDTELVHTLDERRLVVELIQPLDPACEVRIDLVFDLTIPLIGADGFAIKGYFGYTHRQLNLGHWLPTVAVYNDGVWITRDAALIGEHEVLDEADWDVTLNVTGSDASLLVAGPGTMIRLNETSWHFIHRRSREFSLSLSDAYTLMTAITDDGAVVELYTFEDALVAVNGTSANAAAHALESAAQSLDMFADLFGPYPYERLVVVQGDFPDGMEFSGLVFVGGAWFTRFTGDAASYLTLITVHEVAHQWWYGRVGNDPALTPWLDEAMATYSEYVYLEEFYPHLRDWWWQFRVNNYSPVGYVDSTVYEFGTIREYINAVYLRGVRMLHDLRSDLGTEAFFELLYGYAQAGDGLIATPALFWSLFTPDQFALTRETRSRYLRESDVLPPEP